MRSVKKYTECILHFKAVLVKSSAFKSAVGFEVNSLFLLHFSHYIADYPLQVLSSHSGGFQDFFVIGPFLAVVVGHYFVGNKGESKHTDPTVPSDHHFWNGTHACSNKKVFFNEKFIKTTCYQ